MDSERFALMLMTVFGALILGALMTVGIVWHDKPTFLFALGGTVSAWAATFPVMFDRPRIYGLMLVLCVLLTIGSIWALVS